MTVKEWYRVLVEKNVTKHEIDDEGRMELVPCKIEERYPLHDWSESYRLCRLQGLDPEIKSFLFKLVHQLLPSKERVHHLTPTSCAGVSLVIMRTTFIYSISAARTERLGKQFSGWPRLMTEI